MPPAPAFKVALGTAVKARREELGLTQEQLALKGNLHTRWVSNIENAWCNPSYSSLRRLAASLDISTSELIARAEQIGASSVTWPPRSASRCRRSRRRPSTRSSAQRAGSHDPRRRRHRLPIPSRKVRKVRDPVEANYGCGHVRAYLLCRVMDGRGPTNLACARCGGRIGFYERFWWHQPNGSIVDAGHLEMRDDRAQDPASEFYHRTCLGPAEPLATPALTATASDGAFAAE